MARKVDYKVEPFLKVVILLLVIFLMFLIVACESVEKVVYEMDSNDSSAIIVAVADSSEPTEYTD